MKRIYLLLCMLLLISCSTTNLSASFLNGTCKPPCWNNIVIDKTNMSEMVSILNTIPYVDKRSITVLGHPWAYSDDGIVFYINQRWTFIYSRIAAADARFINNKLVNLSFLGDLGISLSKIVIATGKPEFIITYPGRRGNEINLTIINPKKGVSYSINLLKQNTNEILYLSPDTEIIGLRFFSPTIFDQLLKMGDFSGGLIVEDMNTVIQTWSGYGNIEEKYPKWNP